MREPVMSGATGARIVHEQFLSPLEIAILHATTRREEIMACLRQATHPSSGLFSAVVRGQFEAARTEETERGDNGGIVGRSTVEPAVTELSEHLLRLVLALRDSSLEVPASSWWCPKLGRGALMIGSAPVLACNCATGQCERRRKVPPSNATLLFRRFGGFSSKRAQELPHSPVLTKPIPLSFVPLDSHLPLLLLSTQVWPCSVGPDVFLVLLFRSSLVQL